MILTRTHDFGDGNGPVPASQHANGGGWVANTATVAETAYVGPDAKVYGNAYVFNNAFLHQNARVYGDACVYGYAALRDNARVHGNARVYGTANVHGPANVHGDAHVYGMACVSGEVTGRVFMPPRYDPTTPPVKNEPPLMGNEMTTWFKFADTPPPVGVKCIGIWYKKPYPEVHPPYIYPFKVPPPPPPLSPEASTPLTWVQKLAGGVWFDSDPPRYWVPYPPEENE